MRGIDKRRLAGKGRVAFPPVKADASDYGRNFTVIAANPVLHAEVKELVAGHLA